VGEPADLFADPLDHVWRGVADAHDRYAGAEIDQRVSVDVAQNATAGVGDEDRQHRPDPRRDSRRAPGNQLPRAWPGKLGHQPAFLCEVPGRGIHCVGHDDRLFLTSLDLIIGKAGFEWPNSEINPPNSDDQLDCAALRACSAETSSQLTSSTERPPSMVISSSRTA